MIHWKSLRGMDYFAKVRRAEEITRELRWSTLARTTKGPIHNFYTTDFDFAPACPKAALVGAPAMCDQNINEWSKTLQNHPSTASSEGVSETCMSEGGPWNAQVKKSCVYIKEVCASQLSIIRIHCKNWWTLASMFPNCNHLAQPVPTPPDVYTGRTFSASRPIVGGGDRHDVVQPVSNAISEVTICHTVNSPHSDQIPNVVLNMCVTKVSSQFGSQKLKFARSRRAGFRAKDATNPCQQGDQPRDGAVYGVQHQVRPALVWRFSGGPLRSMPLGSLLHEGM